MMIFGGLISSTTRGVTRVITDYSLVKSGKGAMAEDDWSVLLHLSPMFIQPQEKRVVPNIIRDLCLDKKIRKSCVALHQTITQNYHATPSENSCLDYDCDE